MLKNFLQNKSLKYLKLLIIIFIIVFVFTDWFKVLSPFIFTNYRNGPEKVLAQSSVPGRVLKLFEGTKIKLISGKIFINPSAVVAEGSSNDLLTDLVAYWELEESSGTRYDSQGSFDLSVLNTPTQITGKNGNAVDFDSDNDALRYSSGGIVTSNVFTVSFWVKDITTSLYDRVMEFIPGSPNEGEGFLVATETSTQLDIPSRGNSDYGGCGGCVNNVFAHGSSGSWVHIVVVYNGNSDVTVYLNGSATSNTSGYSWTDSVGISGISLGSKLDGGSGSQSSVDEVAVWEDRLLTSDEVTTLYNSGSGLFYSDFE